METRERDLVSRFAMEVAFALATLAMGVVFMVGARRYGTGWDESGPESGFVPFWLGAIIALASLANIVEAVRRRVDLRVSFLTTTQARRVVSFVAPMVAFVALATFLGLYVATFLYLFGVMVVQGRYGVPFALAVSTGVVGFFWVLFEVWFRVPLLKGPLEVWLGVG